MQKKYFLALIIQFAVLSLIAQNLDWAQSAGGNGSDIGHSIAENSQGEVIAVGWFAGNASFGNGSSSVNLNSAGSDDGYIVKFDQFGNAIWAKSLRGGSIVRVLALKVDDDDNIYITGQFNGTVDFDPDSASSLFLSANGQADIFVGKYDPDGDLIWARSFGGPGADVGQSITIDISGNVYSTGWFHGTVDFNPGTGNNILSAPSSTIPNVFISKLDSLGNFVWAKHIDGGGQKLGYHIIYDTANGLYLSGSFNGTADFNPSPFVTFSLNAGSYTDAFVLNLDTSGGFIWAKSFGGTGLAKGYSVRTDRFGNVYSTGYFENTINFNTTQLVSNGRDDIFLLKLRSNGNFVWAKQIGGSGSDQGRSVDVDVWGNVYFAGYFSNTVDFDPSTQSKLDTSNGRYDLFVLKLDSTASYLWKLTAGSSGSDHVNRVKIVGSKLYITGKFQNVVDFDPSSNSSILSSSSFNINEIFIAKYTQCSQTSAQRNVYACDSYTSPSGNYTWTVGGIYQDTIQNVGGCDSVITINLQVKQSSSNVIFHSTCDRYTSPSGKYTWFSSGTYTDTITNSNGCDSTLIIGLIINNSSTDTIYENLCKQSSYVSPSANYVWTSTGVYQDTIANHEGCDSVITVDLTLNNPDTSIYVTNNTTLTSNESGAQYQWVDCNNNFSPLNGETQQSFTATSNGSYAVIVSKNNCPDTSNCYQVVLTGIRKFSDDKAEYSIFPNPTKSILNVDFKNLTDLYIYDTSAKLVYHQNSIVGKKRVDLSVLSDGVYFVKGVTANGVFSEKLILAK